MKTSQWSFQNEHTPNFFGLLEDKGFTMHDELAVPQNKVLPCSQDLWNFCRYF